MSPSFCYFARVLKIFRHTHARDRLHAQRGLQYLVCVSACLCVCVSGTTFSATARNNAPNKICYRLQRDMSKVFKMACSLKMLRSGVTAIFAYAAKSAIFLHL